ncbi:MAG: helix-turn-helix domain-containing protein [Scandinavium sp.]|uniref:helix-turn-helix domain-containing protein n=1 Tax=Scandinavium sp. TaxID=2830653 RepID=UPI003F371963
MAKTGLYFLYSIIQSFNEVRIVLANKLSADLSLVRPSEVIHKLYRELERYGEPFTLSGGQVLDRANTSGESYLWFFSSGIFVVYRRIDRLQLLCSEAREDSMSIFGLAEALQKEKLFLLKAQTECRGIRIPARYLETLQDNPEFWQNISMLLVYILKIACARDLQLVGTSSYDIIRHQLTSLMGFPAEVRSRINVQKFINERARLSRSNVLRVLQALNEGGFITIKRGRLMDLRFLPLKF